MEGCNGDDITGQYREGGFQGMLLLLPAKLSSGPFLGFQKWYIL